MHHVLFEENPQNTYHTCILIKKAALKRNELIKHYVTPLNDKGINSTDILAMSLDYDKPKVTAKHAKKYLAELMPALTKLGSTTLLVADAEYFKYLTGVRKTEPHYGYARPCTFTHDGNSYEDVKIVLIPNHTALFYNPTLQSKITMAVEAAVENISGVEATLGKDVIRNAQYPKSIDEIKSTLDSLQLYTKLTCDIEAFSLSFMDAGIGTIAFGKDKHNGVAFPCDYRSNLIRSGGSFKPNYAVRALLKDFFQTYTGTIIYHNQNYDAKVLAYTLWMEDLGDIKGMLEGIEVLTRNTQDTKVIAYVATNTTAGNVLNLKSLSHEYMGNYAEDDINDISLIPEDDLLEYNLKDCLATWFVYDKYFPIMVAENQVNVYVDILKPSIATVMQLELTGMCVDPAQVHKAEAYMQKVLDDGIARLYAIPDMAKFTLHLRTKAMVTKQAELKVKVVTLDDFKDIEFNPNSPTQMQELLYVFMGHKVVDRTKTKQPATDAKAISKLYAQTTNPDHLAILDEIKEISKVSKILTTFIPALQNSYQKPDGSWWIFGNFNIGGTVSGRLSSSNPNMQNLPSGSTYGKVIKECFIAPPGYIFAGADFDSLEDRISALTTKDKNKLKVYIENYDGHCLRAFYYFRDAMPNIQMANEGDVCYRANVGGTDICFKTGDVVTYLGNKYSAEELYEKITSGRV